jgi:diguanylate cyclase (GGDEF)-like protein
MVIFIFYFRNYSIANAKEKAVIVANMVKDGLTVHMENGIMMKRNIFLAKVSRIKGVKNIKVLRSENLNRQFKKERKSDVILDKLERVALSSGKIQSKVIESQKEANLKIVIPYIASSYDIPNCLKCHKAKENEVLGAISMEFDITNIRTESIFTIGKTISLILLVSIVGIVILNIYTRKYIKFFEDMKDVLKKAYEGNYTERVTGGINEELKGIERWLNALMQKIELNLKSINKNVEFFINFKSDSKDPLLFVQELVDELASVYKFKHIIEKDKDRYQIYDRVVELIKEKFKINEFIFYEINRERETREIHYKGVEPICKIYVEELKLCRACRVGEQIISEEYLNICANVKKRENYVCFPMQITDTISILIIFIPESKNRRDYISNVLYKIKNYLNVSKTVLETKILFEELKDLSMKDKLTNTYNRRYLDIFIKNSIPQALRSNIPYSLMMVDIDYFKMVNDTYGHDAGDIVIKELVNTVVSGIRSSDVLIRFGGEEFLVLLYNCNKKYANEIAESIREDFKSRYINLGNTKINKTVSIGISEFSKDTSHFWQAIKFADIALYKAKHSGRDRVVLYNPSLSKQSDKY